MKKSTKLWGLAAGGAAALAIGLGAPVAEAASTTVTTKTGGTYQYGETSSTAGHECFTYYYHPSSTHSAFTQLAPNAGTWLQVGANQWAYHTQWGNPYPEICYHNWKDS